MVRLMDMGLQRLTSMIQDMGRLSERTVSIAIEAYIEGINNSDETFKRSEELRLLQEEVSELAVELIARYQPVASDLRFIKSCMEVAYGFSRFGRYAFDISEVLVQVGDLSRCDKKDIEKAGSYAKEMIKLSIKAFTERDEALAREVKSMDDLVDNVYMNFVKKVSRRSEIETKCAISGTLILRYLERIADHATYIGDSVIYTVSGVRAPRT